MKPKQIKIDFNTPIEKWANENRGVIMDSIYDNVFEFMASDEDDRIVLQIQPVMKQQRVVKRVDLEQIPLNVDFIISKDDIDLTLKKMLDHYIDTEEYEKCAEIVKLQKGEMKPKRKYKRKLKQN
jgi:hypothetical protein